MTLQELADRIGTTAQSVQRLETGKTKVNLDWLDRFAAALEVPMDDLIGKGKKGSVELLGTLGSRGMISAPLPAASDYEIAVPARDPVGVKLSESVGPYRHGSIVIADRCSPQDVERADGRSCLVALESGEIALRRAVIRSRGFVTLVAHGAEDKVLHDVPFRWLGPIVMVISYL